MGDKKEIVEGETDYAKLDNKETLAVKLAEQMCEDPHGITDEFFQELKEVFTEREIAFMAFGVSSFIGINILNETLDISPDSCTVEFAENGSG